METTNPIDTSIKSLVREAPGALLRLLGLPADPGRARLEDTSINLPEQQADHVFVFGDPGDSDRRGLYLEYQLQPDRRRLREWTVKWAALNRQLGYDVVLVVLYLERGERATFPDRYHTDLGPIGNDFLFHAVRL